MCEHCEAIDAILVNLFGRKSTDMVMKLVKAQVHGPLLEKGLNCADLH
jgi:hypothetical protein